MMTEMKLSENYIIMVEEALLTNKLVPDDCSRQPSISYQYYDDAEECWEWINKDDTPLTSYKIFASNSYGFTTYGFYKSKSGNIYIIEAYVNNISHIYIPSKNIDCLKDIL